MPGNLSCLVTVPEFVAGRQQLDADDRLPEIKVATIGEIQFELRIYPRGGDDEESISMYLSVTSPVTVCCIADIYLVSPSQECSSDIESEVIRLVDGEVFGDENHNPEWSADWGMDDIVRFSDLMARGFLSDGHLHIHFQIYFAEGKDAQSKPARVRHPRKKASSEYIDACVALSRDIGRTFGEGDVEIEIGEHVFRAHKDILKARSPVFHAMLASDMRESIGKVCIDDMATDTLQAMLRFMYSGELPRKPTINKLIDLAVAGDKYAIDSLKGAAIARIRKIILPANLVDVLILVDQKGLTDLREYCLALAAKSDEMRFAVQESAAFSSLNSDLLCALSLAWCGKRARQGEHEFPDGSRWQSLSFAQLLRACKERGLMSGSQADMAARLMACEFELTPLCTKSLPPCKKWATFGAVRMKRNTGKVYHEVTLGEKFDSPQLGWLTNLFDVNGDPDIGVGDDANGWACDGARGSNWHGSGGPAEQTQWPRTWREKDVIGLAIDIDGGTMSFSLNGAWVQEAQMSFAAQGNYFYPALSISGSFTVHFSEANWQHAPPDCAFTPWADAGMLSRPVSGCGAPTASSDEQTTSSSSPS